jgi:spermidine/putrescine transport system substrate-binding protein
MRVSRIGVREVASVLTLAVLLSAGGGCGKPDVQVEAAKEIVLLNWEEYFDLSVLDDFERETGIKVRLEEYGQAAELIARVQSEPATYDVVITDDNTMEFLIKAKILEELDISRLPNFQHIDPELKDLFFDRGNRYTLPYLYGTTGLAVNTKFTARPVTSWRALLDPAFKGRIALFDDPRDVMTAILSCLDLPLNSTDPESLKQAEEVARGLRDNGVVLDDYVPLEKRLIEGDIWITMAYSGDLLKAARECPEIAYVIPQEGSNKWTDNYAISRHSRNVVEAHVFLDFVMRPEIAARISNSQFYASPNKDATPLIEEAILTNPIIYPSKDLLARCEYMRDVGEANSSYMRIYSILTRRRTEPGVRLPAQADTAAEPATAP